MKLRVLLLVVACITFSVGSYGQSSHFDDIFNVGLHGGVNYSKMKFNPSVKQKRYLGTVAGIALRYQTESYAGLSMEINYTTKGWVEDLEGDNSYQRVFGTIEIPLLSTFMFHTSKNGTINLNLGPQLDYIISDTETEHLTTMSPKTHYGMPISTKLLFTLAVGIQYEQRTKIGSVILDLRYGFTFSDIFPNHATDTFSNSQFDMLTASIIYLLPWNPIKKKNMEPETIIHDEK